MLVVAPKAFRDGLVVEVGEAPRELLNPVAKLLPLGLRVDGGDRRPGYWRVRRRRRRASPRLLRWSARNEQARSADLLSGSGQRLNSAFRIPASREVIDIS